MQYFLTVWGKKDLFFREVNIFILQRCTKLIKTDSKYICNVSKYFYL